MEICQNRHGKNAPNIWKKELNLSMYKKIGTYLTDTSAFAISVACRIKHLQPVLWGSFKRVRLLITTRYMLFTGFLISLLE
jgi:hypothetical protein